MRRGVRLVEQLDPGIRISQVLAVQAADRERGGREATYRAAADPASHARYHTLREAKYTWADTIVELATGPLEPGAVVLVATDGLWEAANDSGEPFGLERVAAAIAGARSGNAESIAKAVLDAQQAFVGDVKIDDDVTYVVMKLGG